MARTLVGATAAVVIVVAAVSAATVLRADAAVRPLPRPALDERPQAGGSAVAVFAGGCFWGVQLVFEHVKGVKSVTAGYAGGAAAVGYEQVSSGTTGNAESVRVVYDPAQVSYGELLRVFFSVAHDPTQLNRQGPDVGTQYRSAIFYRDAEQKRIAEAYIKQLGGSGYFGKPIVTQLAPLRTFTPAEDYHQDYALKHPYQPYIVVNDAPKVERLRKQLPELYQEYKGS